jgi:hypothetical protein
MLKIMEMMASLLRATMAKRPAGGPLIGLRLWCRIAAIFCKKIKNICPIVHIQKVSLKYIQKQIFYCFLFGNFFNVTDFYYTV